MHRDDGRRVVRAAPFGKLAETDMGGAGVYRDGMSDTARTLFLVCYDVRDDRRRRRIHRFLLGYRVGGQKSFCECWLTAAELGALHRRLAEMLDADEDRAHVFQLDPRLPRDLLGRATPPALDLFLVV